MDRDEILNQINEQEQWAASALSRVQESALFSAPATSDAEFLVRVRERIEKNRGTVAYRPEFISARRVAWVASACVILLVAVIAGGRYVHPFVTSQGDVAEQTALPDETAGPDASMDQALADVAAVSAATMVDSLADSNVDPAELAQYLEVPDYVQEDIVDSADDTPLTDQLLTLDTGTLKEVLNNLEETKFF